MSQTDKHEHERGDREDDVPFPGPVTLWEDARIHVLALTSLPYLAWRDRKADLALVTAVGVINVVTSLLHRSWLDLAAYVVLWAIVVLIVGSFARSRIILTHLAKIERHTQEWYRVGDGLLKTQQRKSAVGLTFRACALGNQSVLDDLKVAVTFPALLRAIEAREEHKR